MNSIADIYNGKLTKEEEEMGLELKKEMEKRFEGYDDDMGKEVPEELINIDGVVYIDSRTIVRKLKMDVDKNGKEVKYGHRNMMSKIKDLINNLNKIGVINKNHSSFKSIESTYTSTQGKSGLKCYLLDKDMFNLIVMGSTGVDALKFKVAYIEKFNLMEELIRSMKTSIENSESANQLTTEICNKLNEYENKVKEYDKRISNISEFHKKELQMEANARFEAESKLKMYSHIINDVDTLSNGGNTIFNLPPHQEEKIINAGRRLEEIRARRNKKRYY